MTKPSITVTNGKAYFINNFFQTNNIPANLTEVKITSKNNGTRLNITFTDKVSEATRKIQKDMVASSFKATLPPEVKSTITVTPVKYKRVGRVANTLMFDVIN